MNRGLIISGFGVLLVALVLVISLGGDDDESSGDAGASADLTDTETKPVIEVPDEEPPPELVVEDIVEGDGPEATAGDQLVVDYVGVDYGTGAQFDASWDAGQEFPFELGAGNVIPGWDEGLEGMKAGGRRQLTIPPDLAYGAAGSPPAIGPDATLVFVVDLREIQ